VPADILDVSFPVSVRGYDRAAVDAHIQRVNRVIAELKVSASPPAAVRHALDQAGEKVEGLLRAAREAAEEITASARREADEGAARVKAEASEFVVNTSAEADRVKAEAEELIAKAKAEADDAVAKATAEANEILSEAKTTAQDTLARAETEVDERLRQLREELAAERGKADTQMREVQTDTNAIWKERSELLDDIHAMATGLAELANAALVRLPRRDSVGPEQQIREPETRAETEPPPVAADEPTRALPATGLRKSRGNGKPEKTVSSRTPET
jgi:DivIVA domain-containing protein